MVRDSSIWEVFTDFPPNVAFSFVCSDHEQLTIMTEVSG